MKALCWRILKIGRLLGHVIVLCKNIKSNIKSKTYACNNCHNLMIEVAAVRVSNVK